MMDSRRIALWIMLGGASLLLVFILFSGPTRRDAHFSNSAASSPTLSPAPVPGNSPDDHQDTDLVQNPVVPAEQSELGKKERPSLPPLPPRDQTTIETHRKLAAGLGREIRNAVRKMYEGAFKQLRLPGIYRRKS
jgi:hypothetical protein